MISMENNYSETRKTERERGARDGNLLIRNNNKIYNKQKKQKWGSYAKHNRLRTTNDATTSQNKKQK